jgi:hypothetical protein
MEKLFISGIILIAIGIGIGIFALTYYLEILNAIEYLKTLPPGSSTPLIDYNTLYFRLGLFIGLIITGFILQKNNQRMKNWIKNHWKTLALILGFWIGLLFFFGGITIGL